MKFGFVFGLFVICALFGHGMLFGASKGKVYRASGNKLTIVGPIVSKLPVGAVLYIERYGRPVGSAIVDGTFHTKIEAVLRTGTATAGDAVADAPRKRRIAPSCAAQVGIHDLQLMEAIKDKNAEAAIMALRLGANPNCPASGGDTALMQATSMGDAQIVLLLLENGADVELPDAEGKTALMWAALNGQVEIVALLLTAGAQIDRQDAFGMTALMHVSRNGHIAAVRLLIQAKADLKLTDAYGQSALSIANGRGNFDIAKDLRAAGALE